MPCLCLSVQPVPGGSVWYMSVSAWWCVGGGVVSEGHTAASLPPQPQQERPRVWEEEPPPAKTRRMDWVRQCGGREPLLLLYSVLSPCDFASYITRCSLGFCDLACEDLKFIIC